MSHDGLIHMVTSRPWALVLSAVLALVGMSVSNAGLAGHWKAEPINRLALVGGWLTAVLCGIPVLMWFITIL